MYETILWATDGSVEADLAFDEALSLLSPAGRIVAFHCDQRFLGGRAGGFPVVPDEPDRRASIERRIDELKADGVPIELIVDTSHTSPAHEIVATAAEIGADAIVCGTRGLGAIRGALIGSVARDVLHLAVTPVIVVPAKVGARRREVETATA